MSSIQDPNGPNPDEGGKLPAASCLTEKEEELEIEDEEVIPKFQLKVSS